MPKLRDESGSPARVLYPDDRRGLPDSVDAIESFARIASAWGAWLRNPANPATLNFEGHEINLETLLRRGIVGWNKPIQPLYLLGRYWTPGSADRGECRHCRSIYG